MKKVFFIFCIVLLISANFAFAIDNLNEVSSNDYVRIGLESIMNQQNSITVKVNGVHYFYKHYLDAAPAFTVGQSNTYQFYYDASGNLSIIDELGFFKGNRLMESGSSQVEIMQFDVKSSLIQSSQSTIEIQSKMYRGHFMVGADRYNQLIPVNYLPRQDYLKGVIPKEMPASWHLEALKAQALAARTYSVRQMNHHDNEGYDLCDTTSCQVYGGYQVEYQSTNLAVDSTEGLYITYRGFPINAFYHSSSGGYTENSEDVFYSPLPYLKATVDPYSEAEHDSSWTYQISADDFTLKMQNGEYQIGQVQRVYIDQTAASGRVLGLTVIGSNGEQTLQKSNIRKVLGYTNLKSTLFSIDFPKYASVISANSTQPILTDKVVTIDATGKLTTLTNLGNILTISAQSLEAIETQAKMFVFKGIGNGHGLGLSQYGAQAMANQGFKADQIIKFYYKDVEISTIK